MAKQINYLLITQGLTGDSNVYFYATPELAEQAFKNHTEPLIKACIEAGADETEENVFYPLKTVKHGVSILVNWMLWIYL